MSANTPPLPRTLHIEIHRQRVAMHRDPENDLTSFARS
jgi:hypothetical protein